MIIINPARAGLSEQITNVTQTPIMMAPRFTQKELKRLDQQSTENMLCFYEDELRRVAKGERLTSFVSKSLIKRFIDLGIIERSWEKKRWRIILSQKGRKLYDIHSS